MGAAKLRLEEASGLPDDHTTPKLNPRMFSSCGQGRCGAVPFYPLGKVFRGFTTRRWPQTAVLHWICFVHPPLFRASVLDWAVLTSQFSFGKSNCNKPQVFCGKKCAETSPKIWKNPSGSHRNVKTEYRLIWFDYRGTPPEGLNFGTSFFFFETYAHQIGSIFPQAVTTKNLWNHRAIFSDCHLTMAFTSLGSRWTQSKMEGFLLVDDKPLPIPNTQTLIPMHGVFTYTKPLNYPKWN